MSSAARIFVYTDGACRGNPGPGGWAWAVSEDWFESGAEAHTTNQRMELTAVLKALAAFPSPTVLTIVSDSTYVVNCFRQRWWEAWRRKGWRNAKGEPVANQDLWQPLIGEVVDRRTGEVELAWVKGHGGHTLNDLVDRLAVEASLTQRGASRSLVR